MLKLTSLNTGRVIAEERLNWRFLVIWAVFPRFFTAGCLPIKRSYRSLDSIWSKQVVFGERMY
jgi:hypothetical protein